MTADKKLVFRVPADWKRDNTNNLLFHGPHGSTITLVTSKVPDGYPLMEYVAAFLKGIRDTGGLTETPLTRRTQFQDLEAREVFFEAPSPEGEMIRSTTWATVSGPMAVTFILRTPVEQAALVEPIFKTTVQSLLFVPGNYSEFESLRAEAIRTPLPGPIDEVENIVASLVELNSDREAIINRLTPLFLSLPDAAVDLLLDRRVAVRSAAAEALARSKNASLKSFLVHVVEDPDPFVAEPAARRLAQEANVVQLLLRPIMKGKTETIARLWPFLPKETRISLLHAFFSPTRAGKDHKVLMAALMLLETVPPADFKLPLARVLAINNDPLTMVALRVANARGEWFPADQLLKPAASTNDSIKNLALESLGNSASIADIPKIEKALSKNTEELKLAIKKIQFRHELSLAKSAQELQEIIQKADASLADFAWPFNCEATIAGCSPATTKSSLPTDFKVKSFGENLFPQKVRHYTAIPNPAQAVQRFYQTLHGLQLDSPRAQSNLILVMAGIRQTLGEQLGAPPDAAALIDYTGIKPDSPFVLGSWTAPGARDTTSAAHRKAIVLRVKDRERFERSLERLQQNTGNFMALTDFVAVGARGIAAFPAILPISAQAVLAGDPNKSKTTPQLKHSFISHTEWNGIPIKSIEYRSVDPDGNINGATTHLAFVDDVAILTSDVPTLRELLTNAAASEQQLLAGNEEFRRAKDSDGDVVYFSDLKAILADPADTSMESTKKANESGALKFANSSWENSHRMVFDESEWSKPLLPFKPQDLSAPRELLPASTIAYYLMKLDVADALETWPK
ncbi:MAG TPA: HEAT repeat domain-containing protein, partial [Pyrinomonadaceae bacterium]|nr:HEAT repeat domain-containing protein [Pyrinomonadaceae bacterium]